MVIPDGTFKLEERTTAQVIADHLREQIVLGIYRPGQQINESSLANQLQTSRGPLREALQRLIQEGLLVSIRNRGVFVLEMSTEDVKEIYAVREAIELASANTLLDGVQKRIDETCGLLRGIIRDMEKQVAASDWQAIARLDMQFHTAFVAGAGNTRMIRFYEAVAGQSRMCILNLEVSYPRADVLVQEHQGILDRLEDRDRDGLQASIRQHMQKGIEDLTAGSVLSAAAN